MTADSRITRGGGLVMLAALTVLGSGAPAEALSGGPGRIFLTPTTVAPPRARGKAVVSVHDSDGKLTIVALGVEPSTTFDVILDGVRIGSLLSGPGGAGKARFRSRPRGHDQMLGADPRGRTLILRSASDGDVLVADIPARRDPTPDDSNDDDIRCCLPDDGGTECEDRTSAECGAQGGIDMGRGSCLPNPCGGAGGGMVDMVCCLPDDEGTECEDRTEAECAAQEGTLVTATSCASNPCAPIPPANPDIQCCLPDDAGFECEDRTPETCAAQGGTNMGAGTCTPDPCGGSGGDDSGGGSEDSGGDSSGSGSSGSGSGSGSSGPG